MKKSRVVELPWISVSNSLPHEFAQECFTYSSEWGFNLCMWEVQTDIAHGNVIDSEWWFDNDKLKTITHWIPAIEPK